jgi:hypothetical protein
MSATDFCIVGCHRRHRFRGVAAMSSKCFDPILYMEMMPAECFEGGTGDLVICQEHTRQDGESYIRIRVPMSDAVSLANEILTIAANVAGARR